MISIGSVQLENPFILAPLAGYTDLPFRLLCREHGAALCVSEMVSSNGLVRQQEKTHAMLRTDPQERPVAIQLFGDDPVIMGKAAALVSVHPIDLIDINMGCPVKKVVKKGAGAALIRTPYLAAEMIKRVCAASRAPVTVKTRIGWNHQEIVAEEFAVMAEKAGACAITIHARTWSDGFGGTPDYQVIARVKKAVSIPVIGNGDILSYQQGLDLMAATGCDAVMIGRAALGAPWVFKPGPPPETASERLTYLKRHLELIRIHLPDLTSTGYIKNHAGRYFKGIPGSSRLRQKIYQTASLDELQDLLNSSTL